MKQCPKCQANISDTAKFCVKCGFNIKKYEQECSQEYFCPECGTKFSGGSFCPECGYNISSELNIDNPTPSSDAFGDDWLTSIESKTDDAAAKKRESDVDWQVQKLFAAFEYEAHTDGTYTITGLKDKTALQYTLPERVVSIGAHAFEGCNAIKITLSDGILQIDDCAFKACINLSSLNLPESLMIVGDEAFAECEMLDIELPASIRKVGVDALKNTVQDKKKQAEEAREAARRAELAKWEIGGNPTFGSYYWDSNGTKKPIEWIVLQREGESALLISQHGIDCKRYHDVDFNTTWESCTLRSWLNIDFLENAFNDEEKGRIVDIDSAKGKVFLLSKDEAERYFLSNDDRKCNVTEYAAKKGASTSWWLRSANSGPDNTTAVDSNGVASRLYLSVSYTGICVRPALWVKLDF